METLDINGALPWHPVGQGSRPATSPARQASLANRKTHEQLLSALIVPVPPCMWWSYLTLVLYARADDTAPTLRLLMQQQSGSPMMSKTSRKIMEGYSGTFLDRLQADIASREAKKQMAHRLPGLPYIAGGEMAERERESKDVKYIR